MDGGFRGARPTDRRVAARPQQVPRQTVEPQQAAAPQPQVSPQKTAPSHRRPTKTAGWKRFIIPIAVAGLLAIGLIGWFGWQAMANAKTGINTNEYQAVFFTNGQVYFGKLQTFTSSAMKLTNIYYLQSANQNSSDSTNPQAATSDKSNNVQLIKLGDEIHGPEDAMIIPKDQILFYENIKSSGKVAQSIQKYNAAK